MIELPFLKELILIKQENQKDFSFNHKYVIDALIC